MMLLMIFVGLVLVGGGGLLICSGANNSNREMVLIGLVSLVAFVSVMAIMQSSMIPSEQNYPLQTSVLLTGDVNRTVIYFDEFVQDGNKVTITNYATVNYPWTDFNFARLNDKPITITLSDNEGNFIYTDRKSGKTYNENIGAIQ